MIKAKYSAAITDKPWWLAGGVSVPCIAAYKAIYAESYEKSLINLANPGTHTLTTTAAPAWSAPVGWDFTAASTQFLDTGIQPKVTYSFIINATSPGTNLYICGSNKLGINAAGAASRTALIVNATIYRVDGWVPQAICCYSHPMFMNIWFGVGARYDIADTFAGVDATNFLLGAKSSALNAPELFSNTNITYFAMYDGGVTQLQFLEIAKAAMR